MKERSMGRDWHTRQTEGRKRLKQNGKRFHEVARGKKGERETKNKNEVIIRRDSTFQ